MFLARNVCCEGGVNLGWANFERPVGNLKGGERMCYERKRDLPHCGSPRRRMVLVIGLSIENVSLL